MSLPNTPRPLPPRVVRFLEEAEFLPAPQYGDDEHYADADGWVIWMRHYLRHPVQGQSVAMIDTICEAPNGKRFVQSALLAAEAVEVVMRKLVDAGHAVQTRLRAKRLTALLA